MILYLDTSSLVKLYVEELHSDSVRKWVDASEVVATCRVAYPETFSAINRRFRRGDIKKGTYQSLIALFSEEWRHFVAVDFDELEAGRLVQKHALRGFDAVHLSAAKLLKSNGAATISLAFSSFDAALNNAAEGEGLNILLPND